MLRHAVFSSNDDQAGAADFGALSFPDEYSLQASSPAARASFAQKPSATSLPHQVHTGNRGTANMTPYAKPPGTDQIISQGLIVFAAFRSSGWTGISAAAPSN